MFDTAILFPGPILILNAVTLLFGYSCSRLLPALKALSRTGPSSFVGFCSFAKHNFLRKGVSASFWIHPCLQKDTLIQYLDRSCVLVFTVLAITCVFTLKFVPVAHLLPFRHACLAIPV